MESQREGSCPRSTHNIWLSWLTRSAARRISPPSATAWPGCASSWTIRPKPTARPSRPSRRWRGASPKVASSRWSSATRWSSGTRRWPKRSASAAAARRPPSRRHARTWIRSSAASPTWRRSLYPCCRPSSPAVWSWVFATLSATSRCSTTAPTPSPRSASSGLRCTPSSGCWVRPSSTSCRWASAGRRSRRWAAPRFWG